MTAARCGRPTAPIQTTTTRRSPTSGRRQATVNLPTLDASNSGYVSSAASRTIWVQLDESNFTTLFGSGATLMSTSTPSSGSTWFWNGSLSLPSTLTALGVSGLWFDTNGFVAGAPRSRQRRGGVAAAGMAEPRQWRRRFGDASLSEPHREQLLQFPAVGRPVGHRADQRDRPDRTGGRHRPAERPRPRALRRWSTPIVPVPVSATPVSVTSVANGGQEFPPGSGFTSASERSLDVGVVTTINPLSPLILYAGSGPHTEFNTSRPTSRPSGTPRTIRRS